MLRKLLGCVTILLLSLNLTGQENRTINGEGNNLQFRDWGAAHGEVLRVSTPRYADGFSEVDDINRPLPRVISNTLFEQKDLIPDSGNLSDFVWVFGQFIDHDITLIENDLTEPVIIKIPDNDEYFSTDDFIFTSRNIVRAGTGTSVGNPRQYTNEITSFVDGSAVYGSNDEVASWLRTFEDGKLKVSEGNLLPWNTIDGLTNQEIDPAAPFMADDTRTLQKYFVAGDVRANENPLLIAMHTIFVREHNRLCDELKAEHPSWSDERLYQRARKFVGAFMQNILFYEFLPSLGVVLPEYRGYNETLNPSITNVFSAAGFRIGHTLINSNLLRMDNEGEEIAVGSIKLKDAFFNPQSIILSEGIEPFFKGMGTQTMQKLDCKVIGDLRNFLFGVPGAGGLDLAAINIYRGRDRGLGSYNQIRTDFGLPAVNDFSDFISSTDDAQTLKELYGDVNELDPWVGILAEDPKPNSIFGDLVLRILENQFQNLRDGDRFYFENDPAFTVNDRKEIKHTKLYTVLMRNTDLSVMQKNLFVAMPHSDIPEGPELGTTPLAASIFPNPVSEASVVKVYSPESLNATMKIFDINGQLMSSTQVSLIEGVNAVDFDLEASWPIGFYNLLIESEDTYNIVRFIKE